MLYYSCATYKCIMKEEMFDTCNHVIVAPHFATPLGSVSWNDMNVFFETAEGRSIKFNELMYSNGTGLRIEWCNCWNVIESPSIKIVPLNSMPEKLLSDRMVAFQKRLTHCKPDSDPGKLRMITGTTETKRSGWFGQHSKQRTEESDNDYEFRMIRLCLAIFEAIKNFNSTNQSA